MDTLDLIKFVRNNSYEVALNTEKNYLVVSYIGIWDKTSQLEYYIDDIEASVKKLSPGFNMIIDLNQYRGSATEHVHLHVEAQNLVIKAGLNKLAVVLQDNPMLKVMVEHIFKQTGLSPTYFGNFFTAQQWLFV